MTEPAILLGKYRVIRELGRGAFGTVYEAEDTSLKVRRAIKVLHPMMASDPSFVDRFHREAQVAARLEDHPNITRVYGLEHASERVFFVMRLMPGGSLADRLKSGPLSFAETLKVTEQIASALDYSHQHGVIHRDVKPNNILFDDHGTAHLTDFGFVKAQLESGLSSSSGGMVGTPAYIAPEIWQGQEANAASDEYALACSIYEMLTGSVLFAGNSAAEIMTKHVLKGPTLPDTWPAGSPMALTSVLKRALAKEPVERYATVSDMAQALGNADVHLKVISGSARNTQLQPTTDSKQNKPQRSTLLWVAATAMVLGIAGWIFFGASRSADTPAPTQTLVAQNLSSTTEAPTRLMASASPTSTSTRLPTSTQMSTSSRTPTETSSITQPPTVSPTRVSSFTPTASATRRSSPTAIRTPMPIITKPTSTLSGSLLVDPYMPPAGSGPYRNPITLGWAGTLKPGQAFQVSVYRGHPNSPGQFKLIQSDLLTANRWTIELGSIGEISWWVSVVRISDGIELERSPQSAFWADEIHGNPQSPP